MTFKTTPMNKPKTTFIGKNPFQPAMPDLGFPVSIGRSSIPRKNATHPESKYRAMFDAMTYGQDVIVDPENVHKVAGAMRTYLRVYKRKGRVQQVSNHPDDGKAHVWLMEK